MKILSILILFIAISGNTQTSIPTEPEDKSPQKLKHERTEFYEKDGKTACGRIVQYDTAMWYGFVKNRVLSPRFDTRNEVARWVKAYCPIEGKVALKK